MKRLKQAIDQSLKALHQLEVAANEHGKQRSEDWDGQGKPPAGRRVSTQKRETCGKCAWFCLGMVMRFG